MMTLSGGQLHALEDPPLVRVPRVGGLEGDALGTGREDEVEDVGEGDVVVMRPLVVAPAEVDPELLGRDVGHRVIERREVQAGHPPELLEAEVGELDVPAHGQVRTVQLQDEAGPRHRLVLVPHGVRDGEEVGLVARRSGHSGRRGRSRRGRRRS